MATALFRSVPLLRWFVAGVLGRLTAAAAPIAMLAVGSQVYGSVAMGARLAAILSVSAALLAPFQGRRLDRRGPSRGLRAALLQGSLASFAVAVVVTLQLSAPWVDVAAAVLGFPLASVPAGFRSLLTRLVEEAELERASNLDAVAFEMSLIAAPLLVAGVLAVGSAAVLLLVGGGLAAVAAVLVPTGADGGSEPGRIRWRRLPVPGVMAAALLIGVTGGLLEPAVFARVEEVGRSESLAALLLAVVGIGSGAGGMVALVRPPDATVVVASRLLTLHGVGLVVMAFVDEVWSMAVVLLLAGAPVAPLMAVGATLLDRRVPLGDRSTTFALAGSAIALGTGGGQALAGSILGGGGATWSYLVAAGVALPTALAIRFSRTESTP